MADWRRWNRALHRDAGYLCVGLTLVYAISGVTLNHLHDWNSNWRVERTTARFPPPADPDAVADAAVPGLLRAVGEPEAPQSLFRTGPRTVRVFFAGGRVIDLDLAAGEARGEIARPRPVLGRLNALHLNRAGRAWVWLADLYAVVLALLALSGTLILRGRAGLRGRGGWLAAAGLLLPLAGFLLLGP